MHFFICLYPKEVSEYGRKGNMGLIDNSTVQISLKYLEQKCPASTQSYNDHSHKFKMVETEQCKNASFVRYNISFTEGNVSHIPVIAGQYITALN